MEAKIEQEAVQQSQIDNEKNVPEVGGHNLKQDQGKTKHITGSGEAVWDDAFLVVFGPDDTENPLNWSKKWKWGITAAVSGTGFVRIMVSTVRLRA